MPSSLTMHTMRSEESLQDHSPSEPSHNTKHVRFSPVFDKDRRHSSTSLESITESSTESDKFWNQDSQAEGSCLYANKGGPCPNSAIDGHEFVRDDTRSTQSCACGRLRHADIRHAAHRIPSGKTRRESVEGFDDVKRRWHHELLSDQSAIADEPWGFSNADAEASMPTRRFGVHHW